MGGELDGISDHARSPKINNARLSERYASDIKVLDLLKFLTKADAKRIYLSKKEFKAIEYGLKYFSID